MFWTALNRLMDGKYNVLISRGSQIKNELGDGVDKVCLFAVKQKK